MRSAGVAILGTALALIATPAPAQERAGCVSVANTSPYQYPVEVRVEGRTLSSVFVKGNQTREICVTDPPADRTITIIVRSVLVPVGSCKLTFGGRLEIVRDESGPDPVTRVVCK